MLSKRRNNKEEIFDRIRHVLFGVSGLFKAKASGVVPIKRTLFFFLRPTLDFLALRTLLVLSVGEVISINPLGNQVMAFERVNQLGEVFYLKNDPYNGHKTHKQSVINAEHYNFCRLKIGLHQARDELCACCDGT